MKGNCTLKQSLTAQVSLLGLLIILFFAGGRVSAATIHIPDDVGTIQAGIDSAGHGDTVLVKTGTYVENINFSGKNIVLASLLLTTGDTAHISSTIIDGDTTGTVVTFESGEDSTASLVGFTVQNGRSKRGGGILCTNSNPTIRRNIIRFNEARDWVDLEYCYGGGICCTKSSPTIIDNSIIRNWAGGIIFLGYFGGGGGICCLSGSSPFIGNNTIRENHSRLGGGIWCADSSSPEIRGNYLHKNGAHCDEWSCDPSGGGAIGCKGTAAPEISGCTIFENDGDYRGGGIYSVDSSRPMIEGCVIYGNSAYSGGAAVYCPETTPEIKNTIIWSNNRESQIYPTIDGAPVVSYCDIRGGWPGEGNIDEDPLFLNYDFKVCVQSPCLDAGDPDILDPDGTRSDIGLYRPEHSECFAGNVWHVSGEGSDETGNGSFENPFGTIQYAVDQALYGDTVLVHNGSYAESIDIFLKGVHLASNFIYTGDRDDIHSTVLRGDSTKAIVNFEDCDTLAGIEGFTIKGGDGHYYTGLRPGIDCRWSEPQIKSSVITGNLSGINCDVSHPSVIDCILTNNVNAGIYSWTSSDVRVRNSVISGNSGNGIWMKYRCSLEATNTIIWGNFGDGIVCSPDLSTVRYCCVQDGSEGEGNVDTDPLLVLSDYNVCSVSPCIDAGDPDILDPDGTRSDIGLFFEDHPECAFGNCWYIATDGDDISGDGSLANPFGTIQHAIDIARSGDTVMALPGNHHENIRLFSKDIVLASNFLFSSDTLDILNTVIDADSLATVIAVSGCGDDAAITGLTVTNGKGDGIECMNSTLTICHNNVEGNSRMGIHCRSYSEAIINHNLVSNNGSTGIYANNSDVTAAHNTVINNGGKGIQATQSKPSIKHNIIRGNDQYGIYLYSSAGSIDSNIIAENAGVGIFCDAVYNPTISYNVISHNRGGYAGGGVLIRWSSLPKLVNNTITGNTSSYTGAGIRCVGNSTAMVLSSIIWGNYRQCGDTLCASEVYEAQYEGDYSRARIYYSDVRDGWPGSTNIDADPLFCDPDFDDYRLAGNSPCIGIGHQDQNLGALDIGCPTTDIAESKESIQLPGWYELVQNAPNPFNPSTVIEYALPQRSDVEITVYNLLGQVVKTLADCNQPAGRYSVTWDGTDGRGQDLATGVYFYRIKANDYIESKKMLLLK